MIGTLKLWYFFWLRDGLKYVGRTAYLSGSAVLRCGSVSAPAFNFSFVKVCFWEGKLPLMMLAEIPTCPAPMRQ